MSFPQDRRRRVGPAGMGFSSTGSRSFMGYWVPLAVTVGVATISVAAWIWSERQENEDDDDGQGGHGGRRDYPDDLQQHPPPPGYEGVPPGPEGADFARSVDAHQEDGSVIARMQGALRRTPSPQQLFDGASRRVAAGVAAAGAMVGGALSSIREERGDFEDHSRWSEEADLRARGAADAVGSQGGPSSKHAKKTVALVVSSVALSEDPDDITLSEHASILSHLPSHVDSDAARVFVLIYAPELKHAIGLQQSSNRPTPSVDSSYSNIAPEEAAGAPDAGLANVEPRTAVDELESAPRLFKTLYTQAQALVDKESMIMPFSTLNGHVHILRHLSPDIVYVQESLSGIEGDAVKQLSNWVRHVVVVVGDEGGRGGLIDSEDESALGGEHREKWYQKEGVTGIGKHIDVVDSLKAGDDWRRRVSGHD